MSLSHFTRVFSLVAAITSLSSLAKADNFTLDPAHSMVIFKINHMGISPVYGRFNDVAGTFVSDDTGNLSSVNLTIKTASIDTQVRRRDDHLKSPDFFSAVQFPTITFQSTAVQRVSDTEFDVTGTITMRGVAKSQVIRVVRTGIVDVPNGGGFHIGAESTFVINRTAFGMNLMREAVGDNVTIQLGLDGIRQ